MKNKKAGEEVSSPPDLDQEFELRTSARKKKWKGITGKRRQHCKEKYEK